MSKSKKKQAEVEFRYVNGATGATLKSEYHTRVLFWAGARKGWYMLDITGTRKTFLTQQDPPMVERKIRSVETTNPL